MNKINVRLLKLLIENRGDYVSGEKISQELGVSRTTIWKHINKLRELGYQIDSLTRKGYSLIKSPQGMVAENIYLGLDTEVFGKEIRVYPSLDSTNTKAKELAADDYPTGTVIITEEQQQGKGRRGRGWYSPPGTGLWFSVLLRPDIPPNKAPFLTIISALAVSEGIKKVASSLVPVIKWPNDVLLAGKKVCGILSELNADLGMIKYAVTGIGINVNQTSFPAEIADIATSLKIEAGNEIDRTLLVQEIIVSFERYYLEMEAGHYDKLLGLWKKQLNIIGEQVIIYANEDITYEGNVLDVSSQGELIIKDKNGEINKFWAGDVSLRRKK
ncbi:MAG: biotin--[acetyl-CoA-carboxylase] ligase [Firmicutes bacterium]|nr:biotin--[acetyl-CoA-carboxylase] ligase [Bacillota bacterium]